MKKKIRFLIYALIIMGFILINTNSCKKDETTKKDPIITWTNPYEISYGTMLSDIQLNATANVAGTFVYTPDIGIVLNTGVNQILKVNFTPTDAANYNTVTQTVTINVSAVTTVIDIENNVYNTVIIGTQTWMQENLKTTRYRNGTAIPNITDNTAWTTQTTGAYCWYNNDIANKTNYGAFYNYYTVVDSRNLCPAGWHVPTDTEWSTLITYLGGASIAGIKMKATTFWSGANTGTVNSSGFTAFPGGYRSSESGYCNYIGTWGYWWSATESGTTTAWNRRIYWDRNLDYDYLSIPRNDNDKRSGFSVRCIRDF